MRQHLTTLLELAGGASIAYGAYLAYRPAGFIVAGITAALFAWLGDR